jgi:hypothetical protein
MASLKVKKTLVFDKLEAEIWEDFGWLLGELKANLKDESIERLFKEFKRFHDEVNIAVEITLED